FQAKFRREGPNRGYAFEADFLKVYSAATALRSRPIYTSGEPATIGSFWYSTVERRPKSEFAEGPEGSKPPKGAVVIDSAPPSTGCLLVMIGVTYTLCVQTI